MIMNKKFSKFNLNAYQFTSICTSLAVCEFMKGIAVKTVKTIRVQNIKNLLHVAFGRESQV